MSQYLSSARYIDSAHPAVGAFAREHAQGRSDREKAVSLYYAVRDRIRYNPFLDFSRREAFQASAVLGAGEGFCIGMSAILAACARVAGF